MLENVLYYSIVLAAIIGKLKEKSKQGLFTAWIMYFTGTVFHELSHFILSILTFGKPTWFSVFPSKSVDSRTNRVSYTLGYVESSNMRWYNVFFISMAPLLLLPLSFLVYSNFFIYFEQNLLNIFLYIFLIISLLFSSIPSNIDFENLYRYGSGMMVIVLIILAISSIYIYQNYEISLNLIMDENNV